MVHTEMHFGCFLLPLWGVHRQSHSHAAGFYDNRYNTIGKCIPIRVLFPLSMFAVKKRLHGDIVYSIC